jgi:hypothetical protein
VIVESDYAQPPQQGTLDRCTDVRGMGWAFSYSQYPLSRCTTALKMVIGACRGRQMGVQRMVWDHNDMTLASGAQAAQSCAMIR